MRIADGFRVIRLAIAIVATTACTQPPPPAPECDQPIQVGFSYEDTTSQFGYLMPTAVGGMHAFAPVCLWEGTGEIPLTIPYTAMMTGPALAIDHVTSDINVLGETGVFVRGLAIGESTLAIGAPGEATPWSTFDFQADAIDHVSLVESDYFTAGRIEVYPAETPVAFATGTTSLQILLSGSGGEPVFDDTMTIASHAKIEPRLELDGLVELGPPPAAGDYDLDITAGGKVTTVPLVVIDHADAIMQLPSSRPTICFAATHDGYAVDGLSWTFTVDGQTAPSEDLINCIDVDDDTTSVTAHVDGLSFTGHF